MVFLAKHESEILEQALAAAERDENIGICIECGAEVGGVEPDGRRLYCEACHQYEVYGAEELILRFA